MAAPSPPVRPRRRRSLRTRLLAALLATTLVALVLFDLAAVRLMRGYLEGRVDNNLTLVELAIAHRLGPDAFGPAAGTALQRVGYVIALVDSHGQPLGDPGIATDPGLEIPTDAGSLAASGQVVTVGSGATGRSGSTYRLGVTALPGHPGDFVVVAASLDELNRTVTRMQRVLGLGTAAAFGVVAVAGWLITRRGLRPLEQVSTTAAGITGGDLSARVEVADDTTEVGRVGTAVNAMLGRIEASVQQRERDHARMRAFMSDASHELRTPLTAVRAYAELYEQGALAERVLLDQAMHRIGAESRRMSELVDQLLTLARLDEYPTAGAELVDLSALARDAVCAVRAVDPERTWAFEAPDDPVVVHGSGDELRRLLDNLTANVRRHTPAGAPAWVRVSSSGGRALLQVADSGPAVPADALGRLFDRFYRPPGTEASGSGLGLSIVAAVAGRHGGDATVSVGGPASTGLLVTVSLPTVPAAPA